jgi:Enoyl-CoA hydratase/isomerase
MHTPAVGDLAAAPRAFLKGIVASAATARALRHGCGHDAAWRRTIALIPQASAARSIAMATTPNFAATRCYLATSKYAPASLRRAWSAMNEPRTLIYSAADGVARITLNRPERGNGITRRLLAELEEAVEHADLDPAVRVICSQATTEASAAVTI